MSTAERFQGYLTALHELPPAERSGPVALLDLDLFLANAADLTRRAACTPIRVASKSLRIRRAVTTALEQPGFRGVLCYTLREALWLAECGLTDLVVAYPTADRAALAGWAASERAREVITVMVDSTEHLDLIQSSTAPTQTFPTTAPLRVAIDVDAAWRPVRGVHIGALRSPVRTPEQAKELAEQILHREGLSLVGLMAYEGQVAGVPDAGRLRGTLVRGMKRFSRTELAERRAQVVHAVREAAHTAGTDLEFVNGGGTGSLESTCAEECVTEVAAGSGLMGPASFDRFVGFRPAPASYLLTDVVRRPGPRTVTVLGGGWVASGVPGKDRLPTVAWPEGLSYSSAEGAGEVQTPLTGAAATDLRLGDTVFLRHAKAGEPAEHVQRTLVYSQGRITDVWPTYRGEGQAFL